MTDERAELTPAQQAIAVALALGEAAREILEWAQLPDQLEVELATLRRGPDLAIHPFGEAIDAIARAVIDLHFLCAAKDGVLATDHPTEAFAEAAARWVSGEDAP